MLNLLYIFPEMLVCKVYIFFLQLGENNILKDFPYIINLVICNIIYITLFQSLLLLQNDLFNHPPSMYLLTLLFTNSNITAVKIIFVMYICVIVAL